MRQSAKLAVIALAATSASVGLASADQLRFVHTFRYSPGGWLPGAVTGHQTSADPASWALYGATYSGGRKAPCSIDPFCGLIYKLTPPAPGSTAGWTETRLHVFKGAPDDGEGPNSPLVFDASGAAYGTTFFGGAYNRGTVFKLAPPPAGQYFWNETILHSFSDADGIEPGSQLGGLVLDPSGAVYGTASFGPGDGNAFRLAPPPPGGGAWTYTVLHQFHGVDGGGSNRGGLFRSASGDLFGTLSAAYNGTDFTDSGAVYRLTPPASPTADWGYSVIYRFGRNAVVKAPHFITGDASGHLFGTALAGGERDAGTVFRLTPPAPGQTTWIKTDVRQFNLADGVGPTTLSILDNSGSVYGATAYRLGRPDSPDGYFGGNIFRLDPPAAGGTAWSYTILTSVPDHSQDGVSGLLARDPAGTLYTSASNGSFGFTNPVQYGTVFKLVP